MNRRNLILGSALLVTVGWSAWTLVAPPQEDVVQARVRTAPAGTPAALASAATATRAARSAAGEAAGTAVALELPQRPAAPAKEHNLFGAYSYQAPAPKLASVAPPPASAPALPFRFTGQLIVDGKATYLLLQGDEPVGVTVGANIGEFQLVQADSRQLVFQYGPTGQRVPMSIAPTAIN
jgi:hypothetical protein